MEKVSIRLDAEKCVGCNKCIYVCPVKANRAVDHNGANKVEVDADRCVLCGACVDICDHGARDYNDDTERFFADLAAGKKITVLAAPAARVNPSTKLYLRMERAQLDAVSFILETTPGDMRVYFYFTDEQKTFLAPGNLWVGADFDREGLEALLGKGSVVLK